MEREHHWLPRLAPALPVAVPAPLGMGRPGSGYPWPWSVYRWLDGECPAIGGAAEDRVPTQDLAEFVAALRRIDPAGGPSSYRSEALAERDAMTRAAIGQLRGVIDADAATALWDAALRATAWQEPAVWIHADLQPGNVLLAGGRLSAVIDFGCMGLGDPAVDLIAAWYLLTADARGVFRTALDVDDAAWSRGRGWALSVALGEVSYYRETYPEKAALGRYVIAEVLSERC